MDINWRRYVREHLPALNVAAERETEIVDELAVQLETTFDRARANGATEDDAMRKARAEVPDWAALAAAFGRIERPSRRVDPVVVESAGVQGALRAAMVDARHAIRAVATWKALPVAVLLLGTSIAAALTVLAALDSWGRPVSFGDADRLAIVWGTNHSIGQPRDVVSGPTFSDWQRLTGSFTGMAAFAEGDLTIRRGDRADVVNTLLVTPGFLDVVGVTPIVGRGFRADDAGTHRVLISHAFWQSEFGADASIVGRTLASLGLPHEVIGVLPAGFRLLSVPDAVTLLDPRQLEAEARTYYYYWVIGRLRDRATFADAQSDLDGVMRQLAGGHPVMKGWTATVESLHVTLAEPVRSSLAILVSIAVLVLLIGVANTVNLVVSRAVARQREVAIRTALGATAGRLRLQWLFEGHLLSLAATMVGVALAVVVINVVSARAPQSAAIAGSAATLDLPALELTMARAPLVGLVGLVIGLILGVLPLRRVATTDIRGTATAAPVLLTRGRRWLLGGQSAIATLLTAVCGLLLAVVVSLASTSPGFDPSKTTVFAIGGVHDLDAPARARYYERILESVRSEPGVLSVALNDYVPLTNEDDYEGVEIPGRRREGSGTPREEWRRISAGYLDTLGVPLLRGRTFTAADDERAPSVVIVNAAMANKYWGDADPVGTRVRITNQAYGWSEVIGIVGDVREAGLDRPAKPMMFVPYHRDPRPVMGLFVNTTHQSEAAAAAIRRAIWSVDPARPVFETQSMTRIVSNSYAVQRSVLWVAGGLALLALLLTAGGTYAVVMLVTLGRRHEMGVRIALGAGPIDVAAAVLSRPATSVAGGVVVGLALALLAARLIQARMHGVGGLDVQTAAGAALVVATIVAAACVMPVVHAMKADPVVTLKGE